MIKTMRHTTITTAIAIVALGCTLAWSYNFGTEAERTAFISAKWKERANVYAYSNDPGCIRGDMALDIIATDMLIGKTVTDTRALLGEPNKSSADALYYELGQCSGFGWYESELVVTLSKSQQVSKVKISRATPD